MCDKPAYMDPSKTGEPSSLTPSNRSNSAASIDTVPDEEKDSQWQTDVKGKSTGDPSNGQQLTRSHTITVLGGRLKLRDKDDDDPTDWWFASTAIPLVAATFAPMANMLSIAALVVPWRNPVTETDPYLRQAQFEGRINDPPWCYDLNVASLVCGFVGNVFLLLNFTRKVRYIIALPVTIILFFVASGILTGITLAMNIHDHPEPEQVYSQGFWHAVIAATLYLFNTIILVVNMLGYFLGHYPQHFDLTDEQRNLILQTMIFFVWLGGGGAVFSVLEDWTYPDGLYFGVVTLLTIGFGDIYASDNAGKGLVFLYSVGGTIILGLMVSSIHKFAQELSKEKVVKKHVESRRVNTLSRIVDARPEIKEHLPHGPRSLRASISKPFGGDNIQQELDKKAREEKARSRTIDFEDAKKQDYGGANSEPTPSQFKFKKSASSRISLRSLTVRPLQRVVSMRLLPTRSQKAILMRSEKDRFDKMRDIQFNAQRFKKWYALTMSLISFGLLLCVGAVVFFYAEAETQGLDYFEAIYFCYVSLLTIGYGDLSPKSNAGKAFFVVWALVAVPTMTILVSDLGDTVISGFKRSVLKYGALAFVGKGKGWGLDWFVKRKDKLQRRLSSAGITIEKASKVEAGPMSHRPRRNLNGTHDDEEIELAPKTIEELADEDLSEPEMMKRLALAIQRVAEDVKTDESKRYSYEEWVEFTRLIRFTRMDKGIEGLDRAKQMEYDEAVEGIIEWDWLDEHSPMTSEQPEAAWVMDRLLESLLRIFRKKDLVHRIALADAAAASPTTAISKASNFALPPVPPNFTPKDETGKRGNSPFEEFQKSIPLKSSSSRMVRRRTSIHHPTIDGINVVEHDDLDEPVWSKRGKERLHRHHQLHHRQHRPGTANVSFQHHRPSHNRSIDHHKIQDLQGEGVSHEKLIDKQKHVAAKEI